MMSRNVDVGEQLFVFAAAVREPLCVRLGQRFGGGGKKYQYSLDGAVTLRALSHHVALKNLLSLHSGDWQLFILLWLCNKTLLTTTYDCGSSVRVCLCVRVSDL